MLVLGAAAAVVLVFAGAPMLQAQFLASFAGVALLAVAAELLLIRYPLRPEYSDRGIWLSVSTPIVIAVILVYGWHFGVWLDALITLLAGSVMVYLRSTRLRWVAVNTFQSVLSAWAAGIATAVVFETGSSVWSLQALGALGLGLLVYMLVNGALVGMTVALAEGVRLRWVLAQTLLSLPRDIVPMTPIAFLAMATLHAYGAVGLLGVLAPYLALRQAFVLAARQQELYHQTIRSLGFLVQRAHPYTGGHLQRVLLWARRVAERLGLLPERCELVYEAALLHNLGKTEIGASITEQIPGLWHVAPIVRLHHVVYSKQPDAPLAAHLISALEDWIRIAKSADADTASSVLK